MTIIVFMITVSICGIFDFVTDGYKFNFEKKIKELQGF